MPHMVKRKDASSISIERVVKCFNKCRPDLYIFVTHLCSKLVFKNQDTISLMSVQKVLYKLVSNHSANPDMRVESLGNHEYLSDNSHTITILIDHILRFPIRTPAH